MKTLTEILEIAKDNNIDKSFINKLEEFINAKKELKAWQTVLGMIHFSNILDKISLTFLEIEKLAQGIATAWYTDGTICMRFRVANGKKNGVRKEYHPNGNIGKCCNYVNDVVEGIVEWYYSGGGLSRRAEVRNGKYEGSIEYYNINGDLNNIEYYENGKLK